MLRMPKEGGSVYTIVPVDDETKVRQVHRTMLKAVEWTHLVMPLLVIHHPGKNHPQKRSPHLSMAC